MAVKCQRGADVERINQFQVYSFGKALKEVTAFQGEVPPKVALWELWQARNALERFVSGDPFPLGLSKGAAEAVVENIGRIFSHFFQTKDEKGEELFLPTPTEVPIQSYFWDLLRGSIERFETIFSEEMREAATYFVPRRGIYSTPALVDSAHETFPIEILPFIPTKALEEWRSAGRCLAFNLLSASGFHVARAVESAMESYYQIFCGKPGQTLKSWNDYHGALTKAREANVDPKPSEKTLSEIDQMRSDYRNPIMHPRVVLSESDARMLFANGESLIIAIAQEIHAAAQTGIQTNMQLVVGAGGA